MKIAAFLAISSFMLMMACASTKYQAENKVEQTNRKPSSSYGPVECYWAAADINSKYAATLCSGATSLAPIECYRKARSISINSEYAARLCSGAKKEAPDMPIKCYNNAAGINAAYASDLCSGAVSMDPIDCYRSAANINGDYASKLCSERNSRNGIKSELAQ